MAAISKGIILEFYSKYAKGFISVDRLFELVSEFSSITVCDINKSALIEKLKRLKTADSKKRGKYRQELRQQTFDIPILQKKKLTGTGEDIYKAVAMSLATDVGEKEGQILDVTAQRDRLAGQLKERRLAVKQSQERVKQFKRKLERARQSKRKECMEPAFKKTKHSAGGGALEAVRVKMDEVNKSFMKVKTENRELTKQVGRLTTTLTTMETRDQEKANQLESLHRQIVDLKADCSEHLVSLDYTTSLLEDTEDVHLYDDDKKTFTTQCMECVMNLNNQNVPNHKIPKVITEVLKLAGKHPNRLPRRSTIDNMVQAKGLVSRRQLSEVLPDETSTNLYTDETRKFAKTYNVYLATTSDANIYLLGLREMANKSAQTCLDTFNEILDDVSACAEDTSGTDVGKQILAHIKNTMSDGAQTEVEFNRLLEEYRKEVLPSVHQKWHEMKTTEQDACSKLNNFFCGLHLLVNFAELCAQTLLKFENIFSSAPLVAATDDELKVAFCLGNDAACLRVIRAASKCFSRGGDEKSGCHGPFSVYCQSKGEKVRFVRFRGNRFNIVSLLAQVTFYHRKRIIHFLEDVHGTDNTLQRAVLADIKVPLVTAGRKVLGLISKLITAPLWRVLESGTNVLDINQHYERLHNYFTKMSKDATGFLDGTESPFQYSLLNDDEVLKELVKPEEMTDQIALPLSQTLFTSLAELLQRRTRDQLPGGKFWEPDSDLRSETLSVVPHNKLPEFVFGQLDFLLRYRPNATILTNESFLMYAMNRTGNWLEGLNEEKKEELLKSVRGEGRKFKALFKERCNAIQEQRLTSLREKEQELKQKRRRLTERREKLTEGIFYYGLWQSESQIGLFLEELPTEKEKCQALVAQLQFRKNFLKQEADKALFLQGKKGVNGKYKKHKSDQLKDNLQALIQLSYKGPSVERPQDDKPLLVGKSVQHKFEEGEWNGKVISVVPGYIEWYNIVYDGDENVYTYRLLDDYKDGNLQIIATAGYCSSRPVKPCSCSAFHLSF